MNKKRIIFIIIALVVIVIGAVFVLSKNKKNGYETVTVIRQDVVDEVSESGTIKTGEQINLGFKSQEGLKEVYVKVGDKVSKDQKLATIDTNRLYYQLSQAKASLASYQAQYQKLLNGPTPEELNISETVAQNARNTFASAKQNLADIEAVAEQSIGSAYGDSLNVIDDSYLKAYTALTTVDTILQSYFNTRNDQVSATVKDNRNQIDDNVKNIKTIVDSVKNNPANGNIDSSLIQIKTKLSGISSSLMIIRQLCEDPLYINSVSSTDKAALDTQKTNINTGSANVINAGQAIASAGNANTYNINTVQTQLSSANGALIKAEEELNKLKAPARSEDVDYYQAQVKQGEAQVSLLVVQINDATLRSPVDGQIVAVLKRVGEVVVPTETIIGILSNDPFEITVSIYEEDVVKIKINNPVEIKLTAFSGAIFSGRVINVEPAQEMINDVVYYKTTIGFDNPPDGLRPGMTADVSIRVNERKNVLVLPVKAIQKKGEKEVVMVLENNNSVEKEVQIGLRGSDSLVEIVSGTNEGEIIIIPNKK
ncbi:MAG: efflux RND transporter periplasmic adaptor subunit [bacterium]